MEGRLPRRLDRKIDVQAEGQARFPGEVPDVRRIPERAVLSAGPPLGPAPLFRIAVPGLEILLADEDTDVYVPGVDKLKSRADEIDRGPEPEGEHPGPGAESLQEVLPGRSGASVAKGRPLGPFHPPPLDEDW